MKIPFKNFEIKQCTPDDLEVILDIQQEALDTLPSSDILRANTVEMLDECLHAPHYTVGAWYNGELAGFSVLYFPHDPEEQLSLYLEGIDNVSDMKTANSKLCIVRPAYRGNKLQYRLGKLIEKRAKKDGVKLICLTVSPKNPYSLNNVSKLGFSYNRTLEKYGFERKLFYKLL